MSGATRNSGESETEPVRVLGRGLRAKKGIRLTLRSIREAKGRTQAEVAAESGINQADVSRLEGRGDLGDCQVVTLRRYVQALGGELELVARFGDKSIGLVGIEPSVSDVPQDEASRPGPRRRSRAL